MAERTRRKLRAELNKQFDQTAAIRPTDAATVVNALYDIERALVLIGLALVTDPPVVVDGEPDGGS